MWRNKGCMEKHGKIIAHFHQRKQGHNMQRQVISTAAYLKQQKPYMLTFRDKLAKIYKERP